MKLVFGLLLLVGVALAAPEKKRVLLLQNQVKQDDCLSCAADIVNAIQQCSVNISTDFWHLSFDWMPDISL